MIWLFLIVNKLIIDFQGKCKQFKEVKLNGEKKILEHSNQSSCCLSPTPNIQPCLCFEQQGSCLIFSPWLFTHHTRFKRGPPSHPPHLSSSLCWMRSGVQAVLAMRDWLNKECIFFSPPEEVAVAAAVPCSLCKVVWRLLHGTTFCWALSYTWLHIRRN